MLRVVQFTVGGFDENLSYVMHDDESKAAAIVDPSGDLRKMRQFIADSGVKVQHVYLTHGHHDHHDALQEILDDFLEVQVWVHEAAKKIFVKNVKELNLVEDKQVLELGTSKVKVMHTPGHSDDSVCYYVDIKQSVTERPLLLSGDTLFVGGCGRTSEAMVEDLYTSLQRLKTLTPDTEVYPGHHYGYTLTTTMGYERDHNKYLLVEDFETFKALRLPQS